MYLVANCSTWICSSDMPGLAFGPWPLWLYDTVRIVCVLGAGIAIALTVAALIQSPPSRGQRARWISLALFASVVLGTEVEHLGDHPSWRLVVNIVALVLYIWGAWRFLNYEQPNTVLVKKDNVLKKHNDPNNPPQPS